MNSEDALPEDVEKDNADDGKEEREDLHANENEKTEGNNNSSLMESLFGDGDDDELFSEGGGDGDGEHDGEEKAEESIETEVKGTKRKRDDDDEGDEDYNNEDGNAKRHKAKSEQQNDEGASGEEEVEEEEQEENLEQLTIEEEFLRKEELLVKEFKEQVLDKAKRKTRRSRRVAPSAEVMMSLSNNVDNVTDRMLEAQMYDKQANQRHELATYKLTMLPEVVDFLKQRYIREATSNLSLFKACRQWLSPLPDGTLPNLKIREALLKALRDIDIGPEDLSESGIGKSVMFLLKHKSETKDNRKICRELVMKWSRPIFQVNSSYKDLERLEQKTYQPPTKRRRRAKSTSAIGSSKELGFIPGTMIPRKSAMNFKRRPSTPTDLLNPTKGSEGDIVGVEKIIQERLIKSRKKSQNPQAYSVGINRPSSLR